MLLRLLCLNELIILPAIKASITPPAAPAIISTIVAVVTIYQSRADQQRADKESKRDVEKNEVDKLLAMNQLPPQEEGATISVNQQRIMASGKKIDAGVSTTVEPEDKPLPGEEEKENPLGLG